MNPDGWDPRRPRHQGPADGHPGAGPAFGSGPRHGAPTPGYGLPASGYGPPASGYGPQASGYGPPGDSAGPGSDQPTAPHNVTGSGNRTDSQGRAATPARSAPPDAADAPRRRRRAAAADGGHHGEPVEPARHRAGDGGGAGRGRRAGVILLAVLVLLGGVVGGGVYVYNSYFATPDFDGDGTGDVVVKVDQGDSTRQIGGELLQRGVVASVDAFVEAAAEDSRIRSVQPGYYQLRGHMSGASAVALLLDPAARVGQLEIRGGVQLDDTRAPDGTVAPGVLSLISKATCARQDGAERCVSVDDLRAAMTGTDPAALGVPEWALEEVEAADPARRLEGLLVPGRYDVPPGTPAVDVLRGLLATSDARLEASGLVAGAQQIGSTPYDVLTIASLVEKEALTPDMPKVARVIYNRLGAGRRLELDSMVNYPLDLQAVRTTAEDRARPGPYNSYAVAGLPPTPISAPGQQAIEAALSPAPGPWLYFVRCQPDGTSCFAETFAQHNDNVREAQANGAY